MEKSASMESQNDELVIEIGEIVRRPEIQTQSSTQCCIYKVPRHLRNWNEEAYTPQVVSIGPFHHKNERLKAMEEHKKRYFRSFVKRSAIDLEYLVGTIREMEERIRGCYAEFVDLSSNSFVKMILVDACFILELFFRHNGEENPLIGKPWAAAVMLDLVLLENQLPFFVIQKLYNLAFPTLSDCNGFLELSFNYFREFSIQSIESHPNVKIEHFTDLLRTFQIPPPEKQPKRFHGMIDLLYTATQLHEAGVEFKVSESEPYFDIKFEKGVLKIPRLILNDQKEVVTRNIVALEQTHYVRNGYFTDYFIFMNSLIQNRKDVDLLCEKGILVNYLGDNDAAKSLTNNLNRGITRINMRDDYSDLCKKLNSFHENPLNRWKALLIRTYFTSSNFSYVAHNINIMTILTIIQTVCCIIQLAGPSSKPK